MFRRKVRITQITSAVSGEFLFTLGLGSDGLCYMWNSTTLTWVIHKAVTQPQEQQ